MEIEHAGGNALLLRADVRDLEQMTAAVERMRSEFGSLDVLVAAAGVSRAIRRFSPPGPRCGMKP